VSLGEGLFCTEAARDVIRARLTFFRPGCYNAKL
jgi:hypothetical protein